MYVCVVIDDKTIQSKNCLCMEKERNEYNKSITRKCDYKFQ